MKIFRKTTPPSRPKYSVQSAHSQKELAYLINAWAGAGWRPVNISSMLVGTMAVHNVLLVKEQ